MTGKGKGDKASSGKEDKILLEFETEHCLNKADRSTRMDIGTCMSIPSRFGRLLTEIINTFDTKVVVFNEKLKINLTFGGLSQPTKSKD